jgi:hypothetical protein
LVESADAANRGFFDSEALADQRYALISRCRGTENNDYYKYDLDLPDLGLMDSISGMHASGKTIQTTSKDGAQDEAARGLTFIEILWRVQLDGGARLGPTVEGEVYPWVDWGHCVEAARVFGPKRALLEQAGRLGAVAAEDPVLNLVQGVVLAVNVVPAQGPA